MKSNLQDKSVSELEAMYIDNIKRAMDLRFMNARSSGQVKTHQLKIIRRENARIKTILTAIRASQGDQV